MLGSARLQTLVWTEDMAQARVFYSDVLGLTLSSESFGALVYDVGAGELRVSPVPSTQPSAHTVFGFAVDAIDAVADELGRRGVTTERVPGFVHDPRGVWTAPDGSKVMWLRDPDGNLLSVVQYAAD
jgi:catechol 2,3-dioxygenase-like lactoylglutathione lyase family enzyme